MPGVMSRGLGMSQWCSLGEAYWLPRHASLAWLSMAEGPGVREVSVGFVRGRARGVAQECAGVAVRWGASVLWSPGVCRDGSRWAAEADWHRTGR